MQLTSGISFTYSPYREKNIEQPEYRYSKINKGIKSSYGSEYYKRNELSKIRNKLDKLLDSALHDRGVNKGKSVFNPFELYCAETLVNLGGDPNDVRIKLIRKKFYLCYFIIKNIE